MFNLWKKVEEKGAVAIPTRATALTPLEWAEVEEVYPELVPEKFRRYDIYDDPALIFESPFLRDFDEDGHLCYYFHISRQSFEFDPKESINFRALISSLAKDDGEEYMLTCVCSDPGCAGFWEEYCHVSSRMIRWSIDKYDCEMDIFFERESFEKNVFKMLKDLVEHQAGWDNLACPSYHCFDSFADHVEWLLDQRSYFRDMWNEIKEV